MDLYECQARQLLEEQDTPTPDAIFAQDSHEATEAVDKTGCPYVIKAQVKIGHRGQAGGAEIVRSHDEAILEFESILPTTIHGHKVSGVFVTEAKNVLHEYYASIPVDRTSCDFDALTTANDGTEVEEITEGHLETAKRLRIDAFSDFDLATATEMAQSVGFYHTDVDQAAQTLLKMWCCFKDNDTTLVGISPLAEVGDPDDESTKQLSVLGAKISLDDNTSFHHDGWTYFVDPIIPDPFEQRARGHGLHYVHPHSEIGVTGSGAGLVMSSLDAVPSTGEKQSTDIKSVNPLNIDGGASAVVMAESLEIVLSDPQVESVLTSTYGGITSHAEVVNGILKAVAEFGGSKPIVVRFDGNATTEGLYVFTSVNNPSIHVSETMEGAAAKAAQLTGEATRSKEIR